MPREPATPAKARVAAVAPSRAPVRTAAIDPVHTASIEKPTPSGQKPAPQIVLASASSVAPVPAAPHVPLGKIEAKTSLVDFETAPFPYRGAMPGSNRAFLDAGEPGRRGHVNFRGRMFLASKTFGDDRVLLHIPQGFDPNRPAVMVVFFHGHGATLERDARDRQRLPDQISAAGLNAVSWRRNSPSTLPIPAPENSGNRTASSISSTNRPKNSPRSMAISAAPRRSPICRL